jgi:hypothetical protein
VKNPKSYLRPRGRPYMLRQINTMNIRQRFLIVCEGEETEPNYFNSFRGPFSVRVMGIGANTVSLVEEASRLASEDDYDQIWCVFDKDDFTEENFNGAIQLAHRQEIRVAYSNQAFELWYVLHFCYMNSAITRKDYIKLLEKKFGHKYEKNSQSTYRELLKYQATAIQNAKTLLEEYHPRRPGKDDPSTTVFELVKQLNKYSSDCHE